MQKGEWLSGLKVGDEVVVDDGWYYSVPRIEKIERLTKTQIIVDGARYKRDTGYVIGSSERYMKASIKQPTQQIRDEIEMRSLKETIHRMVKSDATLKQLRAAYAALKTKG